MSSTEPVHGKIHVVNQISHPPCTRDAFLKYANEHYEPIVSDPDFSPAEIPKDQILPDLPEVIPPKILPTLKNVITKCLQHSGPIETQDLGSDMEEDHIPEKHPIHTKQYTTLPDFLNFQQLDSDPEYPITTSDIQTSSFTTDCIDLTSVTSEQSERNANSQNTSAISQHPIPNETDPANKLPPLPFLVRGHRNMQRKNLPQVYFVILHQSKYTKYLGKSMAMLYTK